MARGKLSGRLDRRFNAHSAKMSLILQQHWLAHFRVVLTIGIGLPSRCQPNLSLWSIITCTPVVPFDADCFSAVRRGDVLALVEGFNAGTFGIFDIMPNGSSLLHVAVQRNQLAIVTMLLRQGAKVNMTNDMGDTALHEAVKYAVDPAIVEVLLQHGADLLSCNRFGKTPLHTFFNETSRRLLMQSQDYLELDTVDDRGMTVAHYVAWTRESTIEELKRVRTAGLSLRSDGFDRSILHLAAQRGNVNIVTELCKAPNRHELSKPDIFGRGVQHYATESSRAPQIIDVLVANGFDLSVHDQLGRTAVHHAAFCDNLEAIKHLMRMSDSPQHNILSHRDLEGKTPYSLAKQAGASEVVEYLLQHAPLSCEVQQTEELLIMRTGLDMRNGLCLYEFFILGRKIYDICAKLLLPCLLMIAALKQMDLLPSKF
jgi:ankyrin repeat protein